MAPKQWQTPQEYIASAKRAKATQRPQEQYRPQGPATRAFWHKVGKAEKAGLHRNEALAQVKAKYPATLREMVRECNA